MDVSDRSPDSHQAAALLHLHMIETHVRSALPVRCDLHRDEQAERHLIHRKIAFIPENRDGLDLFLRKRRRIRCRRAAGPCLARLTRMIYRIFLFISYLASEKKILRLFCFVTE